jgi:hypothetical protein
MATIEVVTTQDSRHGLGSFLIEAVYLLILIVTVGGWTIVGFVVWVPLLIRTTMLLSATVLYSTLFGDQDRVLLAEQGLYFAVRFYIRGFEHFVNFYCNRHEGKPQGGLLPSKIHWKEMIVQCVWVVLAWGLVSFSVHSLFTYLTSGTRP